MNIVMEYANNGTFMQILNKHRANRVHISIQVKICQSLIHIFNN